MSEARRSSGSSTARIVLGVLTLLLLIGFLLSMFLLGRSVEDAEAEAQTRAGPRHLIAAAQLLRLLADLRQQFPQALDTVAAPRDLRLEVGLQHQ